MLKINKKIFADKHYNDQKTISAFESLNFKKKV